jgi:hypothetical protein
MIAPTGAIVVSVFEPADVLLAADEVALADPVVVLALPPDDEDAGVDDVPPLELEDVVNRRFATVWVAVKAIAPVRLWVCETVVCWTFP